MQDIIIRGGMIADGTGRKAYPADVCVKDGVITGIGDYGNDKAAAVLDAEGLIVAPGFIDAHAHSDVSFLKDDSCASKLYQGITTEITGMCGSSPFPALEENLPEDAGKWRFASFKAFLERFRREGRRMAVNQAMLVGHGSLRAGVMGYEDRKPSADELEKMRILLERDLKDGAWGMSLGLEYAPGFFAENEELADLAGVVKAYDGFIPCHMRNEGMRIFEAMEELFDVGRKTGAHVHVSHLKIDNFRMHGKAAEVWKRIEEARKEGVDVTADMYPFTASCTSLTIRCPRWSLEGGNEALLKHLRGAKREKVIEGIRNHYFSKERAETCVFIDDGGHWPGIIGKTLAEVSEEYLHTTDYAYAAAEVLLKTQAEAECIFFVMSMDDVLYFLSKDTGIGSDGWALSSDFKKVNYRPHPRSYAAVSEFMRLSREKGICTVEEAVRRVTSKAASMAGITDRGILAEGMAADITVFNPQEIAPRATYLDPVQLSKGVMHVIVNGRPALINGVQTDERAGIFLRKRRG